MTDTAKISCILDTNNPTAKLGFEAWIDNCKFFDLAHVENPQEVLIEIPDNDGDHELRFVLKHKSPDCTSLDKNGTIISDAVLIISDIKFEGIELKYLATKLSTYTHDFNGTGKTTQDKFYGTLGCNGTVSLKFSTPVYLWLLEHIQP
jgi:hypothetical protein